MGSLVCKRSEPDRIIIFGLDAAGKTTILYKLKLGEVVTTIPTIGFNVETINIKGLELNCWDIGGRDKIRPLYRHYMHNTSGVVYVIDSHDRERLDYSLDQMFRYILREEMLQDKVVMVLANKQDLDGALTSRDIEDALRIKLKSQGGVLNHTVLVYPVTATSGEGLYEAFECFIKHMATKKNGGVPNRLMSVDAKKNENDGGEKKVRQTSAEPKHSLGKKFFHDPMNFIKSVLFY